MNNNDSPAIPINGAVPVDGDYRIVDGTTVEQWSEWAGFWDVATHAAGPNDARRYIAERTVRHDRPYFVGGFNRQVGAIGSPQPFVINVLAGSVEDAEQQARDCRRVEGFEHVQIRVVAPELTNERVNELANKYWREGADRSVVAAEMTDEQTRLTVERLAALERAGVPAKVLACMRPHYSLTVREGSVSWSGSGFGVDDLRLHKAMTDAGLVEVEAWGDTFRWVMTDDKRLFVTFCEGDVSGELFFSSEAFEAGWQRAADFYENH